MRADTVSYFAGLMLYGLSGLLNPGLACAWARHDLITAPILETIPWLDQYDRIPVTPYRYQDDTLNPNFKVIYTNPDPQRAHPAADEFVWYSLEASIKYGFRGVSLGGMTSARQILIEFSNEPDWDMDKELSLAWTQKYMGGSQGYRHMYYPAFTFHVPYPLLSQGIAPQRAAHFLEYARRAYRQNDLYWYFRFLARALHYVQDIAQPYHTYQTSLGFLVPSSPIAGTTQATKNYHFAYESFVAYRLAGEAAGKWYPPDYTSALSQGSPKPIEDIAEFVKDIARKNSRRAGKTFDLSIQFFEEGLRSEEKVRLTQRDARQLLLNLYPAKLTNPKEKFDQEVRRALKLAGSATKSFLEYARQTLLDASLP